MPSLILILTHLNIQTHMRQTNIILTHRKRTKLIGREHMMQNELSLLGSLRHPRIVRLFAHHHTNTHSYLVMELVSGGDLFEAISDRGKFSEAEAGLMVSDVSEALNYIHCKSIVHRDLKPENLLVVAAGICRLKLGDFGLAMVVTEPVFTICGTPTYVAPEILCETGYGVAVDVWALGVILYILVCGFPPFRSRNRDQVELFQLIKQAQLNFPSPYWDPISEGELSISDKNKPAEQHLVEASHLSPQDGEHTPSEASTGQHKPEAASTDRRETQCPSPKLLNSKFNHLDSPTAAETELLPQIKTQAKQTRMQTPTGSTPPTNPSSTPASSLHQQNLTSAPQNHNKPDAHATTIAHPPTLS
uniref:Doublecortin-like kinase 3 n=1 Tax=Astatotilapia calliptera TaxID=8154 RepID=A0AAX7T1C9_ASTCA